MLEISLTFFVFLKTFNSVCIYIEVWCTEQNSKPLEIEDIIKLVIK